MGLPCVDVVAGGLQAGRTVRDVPRPSPHRVEPAPHCIGIATAKKPTGPFQVKRSPFVCQHALGGDIDPQLFVDPHGPNGPKHPNYFVWKSDNNSTPGDGTTTLWAQALSNDGMTLEGKPVALYKPVPTLPWQLPLVEAPQMALAPHSAVWLFFSAGTGFFSDNYAMGGCRVRRASRALQQPAAESADRLERAGRGAGRRDLLPGSGWQRLVAVQPDPYRRHP